METKRREIENFKKLVWDFYRNSGRILPWRKTKNPYKILVSEIMLQQTQVSRVEQKYTQFMVAFPTLEILAKAPLSRVLAVWQGMGYNRRALALKRLSEAVLRDFKGKIPRDRKALESLPGIGKYTAGAVRAFAFNEPEIFIETNIRRVFIHHLFQDREGIHDFEILPIIEEALDRKNPREWYWALMDYGSLLAKEIENPNKKSKHYVQQKPFKGSHREVRGKILKFLGSEGKSSVKKLEALLKLPQEKISQVLAELVSEGFIMKTRTTYAIKE
mgnify:CR=1 FL=1